MEQLPPKENTRTRHVHVCTGTSKFELEATAGFLRFRSTLKSSPGQRNGNTHYFSFSACYKHVEKTCCPRNYPTLISYFYPAASQSISPSLSLQPSPPPEFSSQVPFIRANFVTQTGPTKPPNPPPAELIPLGRLQRSTTTLFWVV